MIRSIETETYAENPPLFREYVAAPADIRLLMDNQFRNVKTHARLLSKATWYDWRMKLLDGLKEGLNRHLGEMKGDDEYLLKHETLLGHVVPELVERHSTLEGEATSLQQLVDEMENCDQDELRSTREKLSSVESEIEFKKRQVQELQEEIQDKTDTIDTATELKEEYTLQIQEAERIKEECRGWSAREINELKGERASFAESWLAYADVVCLIASVFNIERRTGWSIVSASSSTESTGPLLTMSYRDQLQLSFHPGAFSTGGLPHPGHEKKHMPVTLIYSSRMSDRSMGLSTIRSFILRSLESRLAAMQQSTITPKQFLRFVSDTWDRIDILEEEGRMLEVCGVTKLQVAEEAAGGDKKPTLKVRCTLLSRKSAKDQATPGKKKNTSSAAVGAKQKRVDIDLTIRARLVPNVVVGDGVDDSAGKIGAMHFETEATASKVYGFGAENGEASISEKEMGEILRKELGVGIGKGKKSMALPLGEGVWRRAVHGLSGVVF